MEKRENPRQNKYYFGGTIELLDAGGVRGLDSFYSAAQDVFRSQSSATDTSGATDPSGSVDVSENVGDNTVLVSSLSPEGSYRLGSSIRAESIGKDTVSFKGWKNTENISARLIERYDDKVILECLIDKDEEFYEEREFSESLFEGYDLELGTLFYLRVFKRPNEIRMEVHCDPRLVNPSDFAKIDFEDAFKKSKLFK